MRAHRGQLVQRALPGRKGLWVLWAPQAQWVQQEPLGPQDQLAQQGPKAPRVLLVRTGLPVLRGLQGRIVYKSQLCIGIKRTRLA